MPTSTLKVLEAQRERLKGELAQVEDMRPGSLLGRFRKCGKSSCHCAQPDSPGHGPSWSLTRQVDGKTITRVVPAGGEVKRTQQQLAEYRRFRRLTKELVEVNVKICDYRLRDSAGRSEVKKNAARRAPGRRRRRGG